MSDATPTTSWSEQVASDLELVPTVPLAESVDVYARLHTTLQSALAGTAEAGARPRPPGR